MSMALLSVADALARVLDGVAPLPRRGRAAGRGRRPRAGRGSSRRCARSRRPIVSAMDGYAVRAADVASVPATLKVDRRGRGRPAVRRARSAPARPRASSPAACCPPGADTIVIQENTTRDGERVDRQRRRAGRAATSAAPGSISARAQVLLPRGRRLTDRDVALAAAMNHPTVPVHRRPKVAVLGDRRRAGAARQRRSGPGRSSIPTASRSMALARARRRRGRSTSASCRTRLEATIAAIRRAREPAPTCWSPPAAPRSATTTWCSAALAAEGLALSFWRVALRPGRPLMHGRLGAMHVLGLPGNPVSAYVCAFLFLVPLIRRLAGRSDIEPPRRIGSARPRPAGQRRARRLPARDARAAAGRHSGRDAVPDAGLLHAGAARKGRLPRDSRGLRARRPRPGARCVIR